MKRTEAMPRLTRALMLMIGVVCALASSRCAAQAPGQIPGGQAPLPPANPDPGWRPIVQTTPTSNAGYVESPTAAPGVAPATYQTMAIPPESGGVQDAFAGTNDGAISNPGRAIDTLPSDAGQVWQSYDISPYTYKVATTQRPQQALIDWIIKETGHDVWYHEPFGIMNASKTRLHVYHTPQMQAVIAPIVDRFVRSQGSLQVLGLKMVTVKSPNWREPAYSMLQPIDVQAAGVEGWLVSKENAAVLMNMLRQRADFTQHNEGDLTLHNGQNFAFSRTRPISYTQSIRWRQGSPPRMEPVTARIDEGYKMEISALTSTDGRSIEAVIRCDVDQVEKMQAVNIEIPGMQGQLQSVELRIPQLVSWRLNERFRWPADQVLVLSCGVVATPAPQRSGVLDAINIFNSSRDRADALLFVEYKGPARTAAVPGQPGAQPGTARVPTQPR